MEKLTKTISDRVGVICDELFKGRAFTMSRAMGKSSSSNLSEMIKSHRDTITTETLDAICVACPTVRREWILKGTGYMYIGDNDSSIVNIDKVGTPLIPFSAKAGYLSGENNSAMEYECEKYIAPEFKNADFLTRVQGDSMEPEFFSGDIVAYKISL